MSCSDIIEKVKYYKNNFNISEIRQKITESLNSPNELELYVKNTLDIVLTTDDMLKLKNSCDQVFATYAQNKLSTEGCKFCTAENRCKVDSNIQSNIVDIEFKCSNVMFKEILMAKNDVNSQAFAQLLNELDGIFEENTLYGMTCEEINKVQLNVLYDTIQSCQLSSGFILRNNISGCGNVLNNLQSNSIKVISECIYEKIKNSNNETSIVSGVSGVSGVPENINTTPTTTNSVLNTNDDTKKPDNNLNLYILISIIILIVLFLIILILK